MKTILVLVFMIFVSVVARAEGMYATDHDLVKETVGTSR